MHEHFYSADANALKESRHPRLSRLPATHLTVDEKNEIITMGKDRLKLLPQDAAAAAHVPSWIREKLEIFRRSPFCSASLTQNIRVGAKSAPLKIVLTRNEQDGVRQTISIDILPSLRFANQGALSQKESAAAEKTDDLLAHYDQSPYFAFITDQDGAILKANHKFLRAAGLDRVQSPRNFWRDFVADAREFDRGALMDRFKSGERIENIETNLCLPGLSPARRVVLLSARRIETDGRARVLFTFNDVSKMRRLTGELCHMERLKVASELAAGVGHEIRNPMTSVRGFLQMLGQKKDFEKYQSYFRLMIEELDRANAIITEFLSLTKNKVGQITKDNLNTIITQILPLLKTNAILTNKTIALELRPIPDLPLDCKEIRQLIVNLVKNGLEAMRPGKRLTIETLQDGPKSATLIIRDEGSGIPPELLDKVGTPFFTTKDNGTGIGLSICYRIAKRHRADIRVKSTTRGTAFFIRFPIQNDFPKEESPDDERALAAMGKSGC